MTPKPWLFFLWVSIFLFIMDDGNMDVQARSPSGLQPATVAATKDKGEDRHRDPAGGREKERQRMVQVIRSYGLKDKAVLEAMAQVPRHLFVPEEHADRAYTDSPLPIGYGQTISQPFIVAEMTRLLRLNQDSKVLEVGTGSGYQAAVLTHFTSRVYTIEIIEPLARAAALRLRSLAYEVETRHGDGYFGWPEKAPFDAIVVTAAAGEIPPPLIQQLAPGGRMVIPVGATFGIQSLMLIEKGKGGKINTRSLMPVRFVPLTRQDKSKP
jgi:protein-L-isoaspartate(D-aspartate) O-methyltransferase